MPLLVAVNKYFFRIIVTSLKKSLRSYQISHEINSHHSDRNAIFHLATFRLTFSFSRFKKKVSDLNNFFFSLFHFTPTSFNFFGCSGLRAILHKWGCILCVCLRWSKFVKCYEKLGVNDFRRFGGCWVMNILGHTRGWVMRNKIHAVFIFQDENIFRLCSYKVDARYFFQCKFLFLFHTCFKFWWHVKAKGVKNNWKVGENEKLGFR